jgi:capsular polysaccharide biosynthesis protein
MELRRYLALIRSRWLLVGLTVVIALGAAWQITPKGERYTARSTLYIGSRTIDPDTRDLSADRANALDRLVLTFGIMIDSEPVAARAIELTGAQTSPGALVAATTTAAEPATQLLYIDVVDSDPAVARALANGLADAFVEAVQDFEPGTTTGEEGDIPVLPAYIFERARLPTEPESSGLLKNLLLGGLLGLAVAVAVVLLLDYLDVSIRTPDDAERLIELPVLGVIPSLGSDFPLSPDVRARGGPRGR